MRTWTRLGNRQHQSKFGGWRLADDLDNGVNKKLSWRKLQDSLVRSTLHEQNSQLSVGLPENPLLLHLF